MANVPSGTICQFASAQADITETHSDNATRYQKSSNQQKGQLTHVIQAPAEPTQGALPTTEEPPAVAFEDTLEIPTHNVDQNVSLTLIVQLIEHVLI